MQNGSQIVVRPQVAALFGVAIFVILPLVIAIIVNLTQIVSHISVKEALESNAEAAVAQAVIEQNNLDPDTTVIHQIATDGDYVAVSISSTSASELGNGAIAVMLRQGDTYQTIYIGTGYGEKTLTSLGVPASLAKKLVSPTPDYDEVIYDSYLNPDYKYPLIQNLPYYTDRLKITYYYQDNLKDSDGISIPIIQISAINAAERSNAFYKIRNFGYDPGDYYITFTNFTNPFTTEEIIIEYTGEETQGP